MEISLQSHKGYSLITKPVPKGSKVIGSVKVKDVEGALVVIKGPTKSHFLMVVGETPKSLDNEDVYREIIRALIVGGTQKQFAELTGFGINAVESWASGRRTPPYGTIRLLLVAHGILNYKED